MEHSNIEETEHLGDMGFGEISRYYWVGDEGVINDQIGNRGVIRVIRGQFRLHEFDVKG